MVGIATVPPHPHRAPKKKKIKKRGKKEEKIEVKK
jgi:hypothetical protein